MRIKNLEVKPLPLKLSEPFKIAYEEIGEVTNVLMRLELDSGLTAYSCTAPDKEITGETSDTVLNSFNSIIQPTLRNADLKFTGKLRDDLRAALPKQPAALALADFALFDLFAKMAKLPLWQFLGGQKDKVLSCYTISMMDHDTAVKRAKEWADKGFRYLKIKGGLSPDDDLRLLTDIRSALGNGVNILFDANQGYSLKDARRFLAAVKNINLVGVEQPCPKEDYAALDELSKLKICPIIADEAILSVSDAYSFFSQHSVDMVNLKLMKIGGIAEAQRANALYTTKKIPVLLGCMDEAALCIAASLHLALSFENSPYVDLDSQFTFENDPTAQAVRFKDGFLSTTSEPGLGFTPKF